MGSSPGIFSAGLRNWGKCTAEMARDTLTDVKIVDRFRVRQLRSCREGQRRDHVILPGMKQRIEVPRVPLTGQTMVLPTRFGSVITASSGTSTHSLSMRTR